MKLSIIYGYPICSSFRLVFFLTLLLHGCGGGGGGTTPSETTSDLTYNGLTTPAIITVGNANDIFSTLWNGGTSQAVVGNSSVKGSSAIPSVGISTGRFATSLSSIPDDIKHYAGGVKAKDSVMPMATAVNQTKNGSVSGTRTIVGNIDPNSGTGTMTITYQNYNNGGATYDGVVIANVNTYDFSDISMNFNTLAIKDQGGNFSIRGLVRVQENISNNTDTVSFNTVTRDDNTKEISKQDNFVVIFTYNNINSPTTMKETYSGRVYIGKYGYVDVNTVSPLIYSAYSQHNPDQGGPVLLNGAGSSKIKITPISTSNVRIDVDADGDGIFESKNIYAWNNLAGQPLPPDTTVPTVLSTSPANTATAVTTNSVVTATFSKPIDPATISTASFTLSNNGTPVAGTVTYTGTTATFTPTPPLVYNTIYTATISTGVTDWAGNPLSKNYSWTFQTGVAPDTTPPSVLSTSPVDAATGVDLKTAISATFSEPIDPATVSTASFILSNSGGAQVSGTVTYTGTTATFTPSSPLVHNTNYMATLTTFVKDLAGNRLISNYLWTFKTSAANFIPNPSPLPPLNQSVAYQIDYAHSGRAAFGTPITFPSSPSWSVTLNGAVSYPLIVGGKVFVTTASPASTGGSSPYGTTLYALDEQTGKVVWGLVAISGTYYWSGHAYDHGKVFVVNFDGLLKSFDASTGQAGWSTKLPNEYWVSSPPTAVNGIVYVLGSSSLFAVDESDGGVLWSAAGGGGGNSSPTVSSDGVFVSYLCQVNKFSPYTGTSLWHYSGGCSGGGGETTAYANGLLYVRDAANSQGQIFDAATGAQTGNFPTPTPWLTPIPAFSSQTGFFQSAGTLQGIDLGTHNVLWSFAGDGKVVSAPIVIDKVVIVGSSSGNIYAVDAVTGVQIWSGYAGAPVAGPDERNVTQPLTGLGAGEGYLVVPAGNVITAWHISGP